jgi:hypothetical protein
VLREFFKALRNKLFLRFSCPSAFAAEVEKSRAKTQQLDE